MLLAFALAYAIGLVTGTVLHNYRAARDTLDPLFATYYAIPIFAFYPLFIVIFGLRDGSQVLTDSERTTPLRNTVVLIVGLPVIWELAYLAVGDVALRSPLQTLRFTADLVQTEFFWVNVGNTMEAFAFALVIAVGLGLAIGFVLGLHRLSADAMEPMLVALYSIPPS